MEKAEARRRAAQHAADHPIDPATGRPFFEPATGRGPAAAAARNRQGLPVGEYLYSKWCALFHAGVHSIDHSGLAAQDAACAQDLAAGCPQAAGHWLMVPQALSLCTKLQL